MKILKELGFKTAAMALREDSTTLDDPALKAEEKLAVIIGTEGDGLAQRPSQTATTRCGSRWPETWILSTPPLRPAWRSGSLGSVSKAKN